MNTLNTFLVPSITISEFYNSQYIMCAKPQPEPKAWASLGFWGPEAQAWIFSGRRQAEPSQAGPAHHYSRVELYLLFRRRKWLDSNVLSANENNETYRNSQSDGGLDYSQGRPYLLAGEENLRCQVQIETANLTGIPSLTLCCIPRASCVY